VAGLLVSEQIRQLREQAFTNTGILNGLLLAGGLLVVIGFIDDRWGMSALTKGAGQVAAGAILVATGTTLSWFPLPGGNTFLPDTDQRTLLTILIVVATINAVNFIDGLDGLAAGIVCIAAVSFFIYYYSLTRVIHMTALAAPALASAILIGMCIGFLPHNFSPAKIFMGDTGSMLLGLLLAYAPIACINSLPEGNLTSEANRYPVILPLLLPAALLIIPYADLLLAVVRRTRAGLSPFAPDRKHLHHRLLDIGHSQRTSVLIMYLWAALFSGSVVWLSVEKTVQPRNAGHHGEPIFVFVLITVAAVAALLLMSMPRLRWWQRARAASEDAGAVAGLGPAAAAAQPNMPEAAAELRLAASPSSANGVSVNGISANGISANGIAANGNSADEVTASLSARVETLAMPLRSETIQPEESLTAPVRADPLRREPTEPARNEHVQSLAFRRPPDHRPAGPARSIIGTVPPAVAGGAPVAPELHSPASDPEYADDGWQLPDPEFP
jgi:UDP-GlcNAc:undecaprenyl-phosphate GlcNAc-1-phosphate transferase